MAPSPDPSRQQFLAGFLDDYFAECDDHLGAIRRTLVALDAQGGRAALDAEALERLFRSFHSLKGLAGMVEQRDAELVAHHLEGYLRALRHGAAVASAAGVDALIEGSRLLEHVIAAHRRGEAGPDVSGVAPAVQALLTGTAAPAPAVPPSAAPAVVAPDAARWLVVYTPTAQTVERGVNVNAIRARLESIGRVLDVTPTPVPGRGIAFHFTLATDTPEKLAAWADDGVTYQAASGAVAPAATAVVSPSHFVRVDLTRLDEIMRTIGDIVVARARLADAFAGAERHVPAASWSVMQEQSALMERQLRRLREGVMRVRMVPVGEVFERMNFVVRDLAREQAKLVRLAMGGEHTEMDKYLIERMMDPLLHLVRNAVSHGLEPVEERRAAGKPETGTLMLQAATEGDLIRIDVADDGRGIDPTRVVARARAAGLAVPAGAPEPADLLRLICAPGFSTREEADRASGRGMGMDVVRRAVDALGGTLALETAPGRGTRFSLALPLTLLVADALLASVGDRRFAVPQGAVTEVIEVPAAAVRQLENAEMVPHRGAALPLVRLGRVFGLESPPREVFHAFVVGRGGAAAGLLVDRILGQREIVVRPLADALVKVPGVTGATDLGDGRAVLIIDPMPLIRPARSGS